jgi:hypothetical protein
MKIPDEMIAQLQAHGLFVTKPVRTNHAQPDGVRVGKPKEVKGNFIPEYSSSFCEEIGVTEEILFDAPMVWLYGIDGDWFVLSQDYIPTFGPGDFKDKWAKEDEAIADILDFFFGDPARMKVKADAKKEFYDRLKQAPTSGD